MVLHIKNMVCRRCITAVEGVLTNEGLTITHIDLGEAELNVQPSKKQFAAIKTKLKDIGFELFDDRKTRIVEKIKSLIINLVHHNNKPLTVNLSAYLVKELPYEYNYLSNLFSEATGSTIEKYYINQKIEKIKELLIYDELTLAEIAYQMGYNSAAYLSGQFKKITGLTPGYFKNIGSQKRKRIEDL